MRAFPEVELSDCPESYARLLVQGFDYWQEALWLVPSEAFVELLDRAREAAAALDDSAEGTVAIELGGHTFKAHATGARGGFKWRLSDDDVIILIGSPSRDWAISVRYLAAGLWEHGVVALRKRVFEALRPYTFQPDPDCIRVTRVDWCFDFFIPDFEKEFQPGIASNTICHSSSKTEERGSYGTWNRRGRVETLTIGSKAAQQNQLYNKILEISEESGKTWLFAVWVAGVGGEWLWGDASEPFDVFRLEVRMAGDFLKERNILRPHELMANLDVLVCDALYKKRLTKPPLEACPHCGVASPKDENRWRWPMHPIFSEAVRQFSAKGMLEIGRVLTGRRSAFVKRGIAALGGALMSYAVAETGEATEKTIVSFARRAIRQNLEDKKRGRKIERAKSRYSGFDEAQ